MIPLYTYDAAEEDEWRDTDVEDEEEELAVSKPPQLYSSMKPTFLYHIIFKCAFLCRCLCTGRGHSPFYLVMELDKRRKKEQCVHLDLGFLLSDSVTSVCLEARLHGNY